MKFRHVLLVAMLAIFHSAICDADDNPKPENATAAVLRAFETHNIVMIGEIHGNKQEYDWFRSLVATPEFADRVDDIVLEMGNSLYQESVDSYERGEAVPLEQVQKAWRNTVGLIGPQSPVVAGLYQTVREINMKRRGKHHMRIICGDPPIDRDTVKDMNGVIPYSDRRDDWYARVVKEEVLAKHHRALLIMGAMHFLRNVQNSRPPTIESALRRAGARTYLIMFGTNTTGGYDDVDHRFDSWPAPVIAPATGWIGKLPAQSLIESGYPSTKPNLRHGADALLYLGPRDSLISVSMTPSAPQDINQPSHFHLLFVFETGLRAHRPHEGHRDVATVATPKELGCLENCCNNSQMHEYSVALRISGAKLDPTEVTARLHLTPTQVRIAGQPRPGGKSSWDESMWEYEVRPKEEPAWSSLEEGLRTLLSAFQLFHGTLEHYQRDFHVFLWCGHFSSSFDGGPTFSSALLKQLGDFGVELYLDTYSSAPTDK